MPIKPLRAAEYRDRALEASAAAGASVLDHVREKHEAAAVRWMNLARLNERDGRASRVPVPKAELEPSLGPILPQTGA